MSEINLFSIKGQVKELKASSVSLEKDLQNIIEKNMEQFFAVKFLASEWVIDEGRMDSIGIDENGCPVIFEYKRTTNENVINQGLFYLNWLITHKANFELLVLKKLGNNVDIDWTMPRVMCIASDFNKYDVEAIKQINRKVALIRYKKYSDDLLLFELLNENKAEALPIEDNENKKSYYKTIKQKYDDATKQIQEMYDELCNYALELGDDVIKNDLKLYTAFKNIKNIFSLGIEKAKLILNLRLNPDDYKDRFNNKFRDVTNIGHWGTGDLQFIIEKKEDVDFAKQLMLDAYKYND